MSNEFYEEVHYVLEEYEPVEREVAPLKERLLDSNLWQGGDWYCYDRGQNDGDLGIPSRCNNPFYILGYNQAQEKYQTHQK